MAFKVRLFPSEPDYETLHVAKLATFPLEKRDYKPYSQARVCFSHGGLCLQLLAFEAEPLPQSEMRAVFRFSADEPSLTLSIHADRQLRICRGEEDVTAILVASEAASLHMFTGEDLQGVFWGGNLFVSAAVMKTYYPHFSPVKDAVFTGNLYKLCEGPEKPHSGCFYPADFSKPLDAPENLGEFVVIDY